MLLLLLVVKAITVDYNQHHRCQYHSYEFNLVSHTKVSKLYFYKSAHFLLFLSLSTFLIHHFNSYTKILTLIPLISTPNSPHSHLYSLHFHPDSPHSRPSSPHSHPDSLHSHHFHSDSPHLHPDSPHSHSDSPHSHPDSRPSHHFCHSVPRFPIPAFTEAEYTFKRVMILMTLLKKLRKNAEFFLLKELRNYARHKNRRKHNEHFKLLFLRINLLFGISNLMSANGKLH